MCFRPAEAGGFASDGHTCPHCGKTVQFMGGVVLKQCPFCKGDLTSMLAAGRPEPARSAFHPQAAFGVIACW